MWLFYGIEIQDVSVTRAALLLRVLVVDIQPFQALLSQQFQPRTEWQQRSALCHRLIVQLSWKT